MPTCRPNKCGWILIGFIVFIFVIYYFNSELYISKFEADVISVKGLLKTCVHTAEEAGNLLKKLYDPEKLGTKAKNEGGPKNEVLTNMDIASHNLITQRIKKAFPNIKVLSEEHPPTSSDVVGDIEGFHSEFLEQLPDRDMFMPTSSLAIWVDPLDATQELTEGLLEYVTVMICVALNGFPLIGVIHQPFVNQTYWSWLNIASSETITSEAKKSAQPMDELVIIHSRSHLDDNALKRVAAAFSPQKVRFLPAGGSGFKVLSLLRNTAQLYVHPSRTRRWDVCAAQAVLEAAGGRLTGLDGSRLSFAAQQAPQITSGLLAARNTMLHKQWQPKLASLLADKA